MKSGMGVPQVTRRSSGGWGLPLCSDMQGGQGREGAGTQLALTR